MQLAPLGLVFMVGTLVSGGPKMLASDGNVFPLAANTGWAGTYTCAQGLTGVQLTLLRLPVSDAAIGHFEFRADDTNPSVPSGDYWLYGTARVEDDSTIAVHLVPHHWGVRPASYFMVGLTARIDVGRAKLVGTIDELSCGSISTTIAWPAFADD